MHNPSLQVPGTNHGGLTALRKGNACKVESHLASPAAQTLNLSIQHIYNLAWSKRCILTGVIAFPVSKKLRIFSIPSRSKPMWESMLVPAV